ncbi:MAG: TonB-dependent receptor [Cytophagia bacterium]|nr:MAG: TonB-dependent receptor [Cytophagia bacterium]TAG46059.1 MAG: TonB-dependent receptor [Cytophagia bacterium]
MNYFFTKQLFVLIFIFFLPFSQYSFAQEKVTISGYVKDAKSGETLIGASVFLKDKELGVSTNVYGFYSISVPKGKYTLVCAYITYQSKNLEVDLQESQKIDIELEEENKELQEVVINGELDQVKRVEMSVNKLDIKTISKIPAFLGEVDIIRSILFLPGVSTVGEGATGFNVRGGGVDQNLVLLDEAPVYNSSHLFGFFSVFNPDAVKDVKLVKGGAQAQYGGRLSSILDVRLKEGNNKTWGIAGGVGLIFSRLMIEAPIKKDKGSFLIAARRSYLDILAKPFLSGTLKEAVFNFYDLTMKANYKLGSKDQIFLSGYFGRDNFGSPNAFKFNWGNTTATLRWNHVFGDKLFMNLTTFYSNYDYRLGFGTGRDTFDWNSKILNYSIKPEFNWYLNEKNTITFGGQSIFYTFEPGSAVATSNGQTINISLPKRYSLENAVFIGNEQTVNSRFSMQYGLRFSWFNYLGPGEVYEYANDTPVGQRKPTVSIRQAGNMENVKTYYNFEPRFSAKYELTSTQSIKASYNRMAQYIHLISNTTASTPLDVWTPSTNNIKPQLADQVAVGYFRNQKIKGQNYEFSVEGYYKTFQNVIDYIDGADLLLNRFLEGDLLVGKGRAYGLEFFIKKATGKFNGWISYTLARTERQIVGINRGDWYPNRFDQLHRLNLVGFYELNDRWSFSADLQISTGTPATFPTNRIEVQGYAIPHNSQDSRNNVRIPWYHRVDISATLQGRKFKKNGKKRKNEDYWVFSVYNIYNRRNPFSIYFRQNPDVPAQTEAVRFSVIGSFIPSASYNFKF